MEIFEIAAEILQYRPELWTDRQTFPHLENYDWRS